MQYVFKVLSNHQKLPKSAKETIYLESNFWDDYGFKTQFYLSVFDSLGVLHEIGSIKVGQKAQKEEWTLKLLDGEFTSLKEAFFSVGQDSEFYQNLKNLPITLMEFILTRLNDVTYNEELLNQVVSEDVFKTSLSRGFGKKIIVTQFRRVLGDEPPLTPYNFCYCNQFNTNTTSIKLEFNVAPDSYPMSNIHVLIGSNGVGKTTLLNSMVTDAVSSEIDKKTKNGFYDISNMLSQNRIAEDYFLNVISVSFSAFDPFKPPKEKDINEDGPGYSYIGLRSSSDENNFRLKDIKTLWSEFADSITNCCRLRSKINLWLKAIKIIETDPNLAELKLSNIVESDDDIDESEKENKIKQKALRLISKTSSGHTIVLLTITKLIEAVEQKSLVLIDEPETHLHPPLLSAFTKAISKILTSQNGVAILATHSPVVIQMIPKSCVSKIFRRGTYAKIERLPQETFGENLGVLTREVFNLEIEKSGFHDELNFAVLDGENRSYEDILHQYKDQVGYEGKAILRAMVFDRDKVLEDQQ